MDEKAYKEQLAEEGVDLPELKETEEKSEETPPQKDAPEKEEDTEEKAPLQTPKEQRRRSIYDDYKEKKVELKTEKERREHVEKERDELKSRLEALNNADTPEEKKEAADDLEAFAKEINADPAAIKKMRDLFLKDVQPKTDTELKQKLERFEAWQKANAPLIEKQMFDQEYNASLPKLQKLFPNATQEEMTAIRAELDKLSHTKEWHDKPLSYIAFENQDTLATLLSPKKRGIETKSRKDGEERAFEFDPEADLSKMTMKEREQWEENYRKIGKQSELATDTQGRKILI